MPKQFTPVSSKLVPILMPNVDTDQIIPAQYVNAVGEQALADALFANRKAEKPDFVLNAPGMKGRSIMLAGPNFGCGSSREAAAWALEAAGFRALIGTTFNETFAKNCVQNCLPTVKLLAENFKYLTDAFSSDPDIELTIDLKTNSVGSPAHGIHFPAGIDPFIADLMIRGIDELSYLLERRDLIARFEIGRIVT